jgi:ribosomal protein L24E
MKTTKDNNPRGLLKYYVYLHSHNPFMFCLSKFVKYLDGKIRPKKVKKNQKKKSKKMRKNEKKILL